MTKDEVIEFFDHHEFTKEAEYLYHTYSVTYLLRDHHMDVQVTDSNDKKVTWYRYNYSDIGLIKNMLCVPIMVVA